MGTVASTSPIVRDYQRTDRDHRLRAGRSARGHFVHRAATRVGSCASWRIQYARAVRPEGNPASRRLIDEVFEVCDRKWRGIGLIPQSGYKLRDDYRDHDAERIFDVEGIETHESSICVSGRILKGAKETARLPGMSARECTPQTPLGATMVSVRRGLCRVLCLRPVST